MEKKKRVKYPIGQQSFKQLREGGYLYVDKTSFIEKILDGQYYFLGRPRRFGKSLFLSTLKCFFEGRRELFGGLYIDSVGWNWEPYPVIHIDLNMMQYREEGDLDTLVEYFISDKEKEYDITPEQTSLSVRFSNLIKKMSETTGKGVVILVDEYDKPLVNNIHDRDRFEMYRDKLASLYSNFKSSAEYIRLVFLTGVSRFGKLSVFSGLNNISDISFDTEFSAVCGITEEELLSYFTEGITRLSEENESSYEEEVTRLKRWYDGYHFAKRSPDIYNPFSILQVMAKLDYRNYWIASGTPTLLAEQLKRKDANLKDLLNKKCNVSALQGLDIDNIPLESLFYQTGYLTIKKYDPRSGLYTLGLPNVEVEEGFFEFLLPYYSNLQGEDTRVFVFDLLDEIEEGRVDDFMRRLQSMFAGIGYDMRFDDERNVQNAMLILFSLLGIQVDTEVKTSDGRIDILIRTDRYVYIMELKYDGSAEEALAQISRKEYSLPWAIDKRRVIEIGFNYNSDKRRIDAWKVKEI